MSSSNAVAQQAQSARSTMNKQEHTSGVSATEIQQENVEVDDVHKDTNLAFGNDNKDTASIASGIYRGLVENGRRYQTLREGEYWGPSDAKQFEAMNIMHVVHRILDSQLPNSLFYSPIPNTAHILDVGTGSGIWAKEVADLYPSATVRGVDLYPPPDTWVPPNCILEVDDVLKPWDYRNQFDLVHMRLLVGAFSDNQWRLLYKQAYNNTAPGGYIEHLEASVSHHCDDGTLPPDSALANWGPMFERASAKSGRHLDALDKAQERIQAAGFVNIQEKTYKVPYGDWAKHPLLKEAGRFNMEHFLEGLEGYAMFLLTKFGDPEPWKPEEVQLLLVKVRKELNNRYHTYLKMKRVWAMKPLGC